MSKISILKKKNKRGVFDIEARRGSQEYEILLSYPNLDVINVKKTDDADTTVNRAVLHAPLLKY
ncbi:hypothetical protein PKHYL_02540 [Psychrobacter sp. KH172YL61]|nr:hypothetical protein PKHYL_02540 [Psychrobacter sp. KH172YL61]